MPKKTEITNEKLALMIGKGFEYMDKGFETIDKRFEQVDKRFIELKKKNFEMDEKLDDIRATLKNVVYRFEFKDLDRRVKKLELKLGFGKR